MMPGPVSPDFPAQSTGRLPCLAIRAARTAPSAQTHPGRLATGDSGDEIALLGGVDMLLESNDLPVVQGPHVGHLHFGRLARPRAVPGVGAEGHHGVVLGDQLRDTDGEVVANLS